MCRRGAKKMCKIVCIVCTVCASVPHPLCSIVGRQTFRLTCANTVGKKGKTCRDSKLNCSQTAEGSGKKNREKSKGAAGGVVAGVVTGVRVRVRQENQLHRHQNHFKQNGLIKRMSLGLGNPFQQGSKPNQSRLRMQFWHR